MDMLACHVMALLVYSTDLTLIWMHCFQLYLVQHANPIYICVYVPHTNRCGSRAEVDRPMLRNDRTCWESGCRACCAQYAEQRATVKRGSTDTLLHSTNTCTKHGEVRLLQSRMCCNLWNVS